MREILKQQIDALSDGSVKKRLTKIYDHHPEVFKQIGATVLSNRYDQEDYEPDLSWLIEVSTQDPHRVFAPIAESFWPEEIPIIQEHLRLTGAINKERDSWKNTIEAKITQLQELIATIDVLFESRRGRLK